MKQPFPEVYRPQLLLILRCFSVQCLAPVRNKLQSKFSNKNHSNNSFIHVTNHFKLHCMWIKVAKII